MKKWSVYAFLIFMTFTFTASAKSGLFLSLEGKVVEENKEEVTIQSNTGNYTLNRANYPGQTFKRGERKKLKVDMRDVVLLTDARQVR